MRRVACNRAWHCNGTRERTARSIYTKMLTIFFEKSPEAANQEAQPKLFFNSLSQIYLRFSQAKVMYLVQCILLHSHANYSEPSIFVQYYGRARSSRPQPLLHSGTRFSLCFNQNRGSQPTLRARNTTEMMRDERDEPGNTTRDAPTLITQT